MLMHVSTVGYLTAVWQSTVLLYQFIMACANAHNALIFLCFN